MNYRKKILISIVVLLIISALFYFYTLNIINCNKINNYTCSSWVFDELIPFLVFTPLFISASLLVTLIFSERVFNIWKKFAMVAIPLMIIGILLVKVNPVECGVLICVDRTFMILFSGILYLVLSVLTVIIPGLYFYFKKSD